MSDRTEKPTARRLAKAYRDGDVAVSIAFLQALAMVVAMALAGWVAESTKEFCVQLLYEGLSPLRDDSPGSHDILLSHPHLMMLACVTLTIPVIAAVWVIVLLAGMLQTRGVFVVKKVIPDLKRLSPLAMFRSLFSPVRLFAIVRAVVTSLTVTWLVYKRLEQHAVDLVNASGSARVGMYIAGHVTWLIVRDVTLVMLVLGVVDVIVSRRTWMSRLKMTREQVKREHQESEGDPQLKAARKQAHQQLLQASKLQAVRDATAVIVNPEHYANALRYEPDFDEAPMLLAKGQGEFAVQIVHVARLYSIPIVQNIAVARALAELTEGEAIPPGLYEAVAEILRDLMELDDEAKMADPIITSENE